MGAYLTASTCLITLWNETAYPQNNSGICGLSLIPLFGIGLIAPWQARRRKEEKRPLPPFRKS